MPPKPTPTRRRSRGAVAERTVTRTTSPPGLRSRRLAGLFDGVRLDLIVAVRSLRRTPALTVAVLCTLAIGLGANAAIYSVVRGVLLQPLPFAEPERLVRIGGPSTAAQIDAYRSLDRAETVSALGAEELVLRHDGAAHELRGLLVDGRHHELFGVAPRIGRALRPADDLAGAEPVVVLGHDVWLRFFDGDTSVLGRSIPLGRDGTATHRVVGVMDAGYRPSSLQADFLLPHGYQPDTHDWDDMARFWSVARLSPGVGTEELQAEARTIASTLAEEGRTFDRDTARDLEVVSLLKARVGRVELQLWLLFAAAMAVLLTGCANVANLFLVRQLTRRREFSLRRALGAGRLRLARQMVSEGLVLSLVGGVLGTGLAAAALPPLLASLPSRLPRVEEISLDASVLAFTLALSILAGVVFGLTPMARLREAPLAARADDDQGSPSARRLQAGLVAGQLALALVLVSCCTLLVQSMVRLQGVDPGFEVAGLHALRLSPPSDRYNDDAARARYLQQVEQAVAATPGIEHVGSISALPLTPVLLGVGISPDGRALPEGERPLMINYRAITPGYPRTAGVPVLRGRGLRDSDRREAPPVGLINQRLAELLFADQDPIGRPVVWGTGEDWFTVVGVLGDVRQTDLASEVRAEAYLPYAQEAWVGGMPLLARADESRATRETLAAAALAVDPLVPIGAVRTMTEVQRESLSEASFNAGFFAAFGLLALFLAVIGVYGTTLYVVSQRIDELGVRLALGADRRRRVRHWGAGDLPTAAPGLLAGYVGSLLSVRWLETLLFQVRPGDPTALTAVLVLLGGGALAVSALAARRIARLDATAVLRRG